MADPEPPKADRSNGAEFLAGGDMWSKWRNFYRMASGSMSQVGQEKYWKDADVRYEKVDCKRCETQRDYLLQYSPIVRYMSENIKRLGGDLGKHNMRCKRCDTAMEGGFDPKYGILLCANRVEKQSQMEDVMAHEMTHAYDHLRFKVDWDAADLRHVACTEIRASNLSGECRWMNEFFGKRQFQFNMHHQDCVRRRAILSVRSRPHCKDDVQAVKVVNEVWDSCFRDTRPFDEIFR